MNTERNCQSCKYYKDGYCENLELKPCYPLKGCDDFENKDLDVLDKIRAEIAEYGSIIVSYAITKDAKTDKGIEKLVSGVLKQAKEQVLEIIDKYKADKKPTCGNCKEWGTVNCTETYREPTKNDDICDSFKAESEEV